MSELVQKVAKLAAKHPELHKYLNPLLKSAGMVSELAIPVDGLTKRGAHQWIMVMRQIILGKTQPGSPERKAYIAEAKKQLGDAGWLMRGRAVGKFLDASKAQFDDLLDTYAD